MKSIRNEMWVKSLKKSISLGVFSIIMSSCAEAPKRSVPSESESDLVVEMQTCEETGETNVQYAPTIKVYIENSASMDGYVNGVTDFENAVYSYLSDLQSADLGKKDALLNKNRLELNYINSKIIQFKPDVKEFIQKIEPSTFKIRGGNRGSSDMSDLLDTLMNQIATNRDVVLFVSDCIFSPGKKYKTKDNADEYLIQQQIGIKEDVRMKMQQAKDFACVIMQLTSQFNGFYYNKFDEPKKIEDRRPFYMWLLGSSSNVKRIVDAVKFEDIKGSFQNVVMFSNDNSDLLYAIAKTKSLGEFDISREDPRKCIEDAEPVTRGEEERFMLAVGVDFSQKLLAESYLMNPNNYEVTQPYTLSIKKNEKGGKYSHTFYLDLPNPRFVPKGQISVRLKNNLPNWILDSSDDNGGDINALGAMRKTYGLKYLLGGLYDAFDSNDLCDIKINVK